MTSPTVVRELNDNDVLLGRGSGSNLYCGNLQFRDLVAEKREEYKDTNFIEEKRRIAQAIVDIVHSKGGRFLRKQAKKKGDGRAEWAIVNDSVALEKTKQALREKHPPTTSSSNHSRHDLSSSVSDERASLKRAAESDDIEMSLSPQPEVATAISSSEASVERLMLDDSHIDAACAAAASPLASPLLAAAEDPTPPSVLSAVLPSMITSGISVPPPVAPMDTRLLLFRQNVSSPLQQLSQASATSPAISSLFRPHHSNQQFQGNSACLPPTPTAHEQLLQELQQTLREAAASNAASQVYQQFRDSLHIHSAPVTPEPPQSPMSGTCEGGERKVDEPESEDGASDNGATDDEVAAFLLSSLSVSDRPVITAQQEAMEKEALSDEEKALIIADAFGSRCSIGGRQNKKARNDLDEETIAFLLRLMRTEINNIPAKDKAALLEAQTKAHAEEFSDAWLQRFLHCEGMNAKVPFVLLWPLFQLCAYALTDDSRLL